MIQRDYLVNFEKLCGIKKPIFLDTTDTWKIFDNDLVLAKDLKTEHSIGRQRLSFRNSEVCEVWIDVDNHDNIPFKQYKEERLTPAIQKLNSLGISNEFIFPKISGTGVHLHVFISELPKNVDVDELFQKTATENVDQRSVVEKQRIREYGAYASTKNGFTGWSSIANLLKARTLPIFKEPVYPEVKLFKCNPKFLIQLSFVKEDQAQEKMEHEPIVDYERDGDFMQLFKCPLIANLDRKSRTDHHLRHDPRVFLMTQFIHFGEASRKKLHEIMSQCSDYDPKTTQDYLEHAMQNGYHPETCARAKELRLGCPDDCKGSGGKSPIKFAWTPLKLAEITKEYQNILLLSPEDSEVIDVVLADIFDPRIEGDLTWLLFIAPPSWGKTVILETINDPKWCEFVDLITDKTFISGKTYTDKLSKEDMPIEGLLPKLHMRSLVCKEFTTQLMQGEQIRKTIFGQLRAIYDCNYSQAFGSFDYSKIPESWKHVRMGFIAGCTLYIDKYSTMNVILGERYLKLRMRRPDRLAAIRFARLNAQEKDKKKEYLKRKTKRFLANIIIPKKFDYPPDHIGTAMDYLSEFIVRCRAPVDRTQMALGEIVYEYEEEHELGTRFVQQIQRLGWMLTIVRETMFDENVYKTLFRVAMDTLPPNRKDVLLFLGRQPKSVNQTTIMEKLGWGNYRTKTVLKELVLIGVIKETQNLEYELDKEIRTYLQKAMKPLHSSKDSTQDGTITTSLSLNILKYCTVPISQSNYVENDGKCDNFEFNADCRGCAELSSCDKPALRRTLMRVAVKCACHRCDRPAPHYPMTRWCRECLTAGRYVFWAEGP